MKTVAIICILAFTIAAGQESTTSHYPTESTTEQNIYGTRTSQEVGSTTEESIYGQRSTSESSTPVYGEQTSTTHRYGKETSTPKYGEESTTVVYGQETSTPIYGEHTSTTQRYGEETSTPKYGERSTTEVYGQETSISPIYGEHTSTTPIYGEHTSTTPIYGEHTSTTQRYGEETSTPKYGERSTTEGSTIEYPEKSTTPWQESSSTSSYVSSSSPSYQTVPPYSKVTPKYLEDVTCPSKKLVLRCHEKEINEKIDISITKNFKNQSEDSLVFEKVNGLYDILNDEIHWTAPKSQDYPVLLRVKINSKKCQSPTIKYLRWETINEQSVQLQIDNQWHKYQNPSPFNPFTTIFPESKSVDQFRIFLDIPEGSKNGGIGKLEFVACCN